MKLRYKAVELTEFGSLQHIELELDRGGLWFMFGENLDQPRLQSNGCGKSTIWNGVSWIQFGKTLAGMRSTDVVPWRGGSPLGRLWVEIDGQDHVLERRANPNGFTFDGQEIDQSALCRELGMNYDTFTNTFAIGQGQPLFLDRTPGEKLKLFSDALELERWDQRSATAKTKQQTLLTETIQLKATFERTLQQFREVKTLHETAKRRADEWQSEQQDRFNRCQQEIVQLTPIADKLQKRHDNADLAYDGATTELRPLRTQLTTLRAELRTYENDYNRAKLAKDAALALSNKLRSQLKTARDGRCPLCNNALHSKTLVQKLAEDLRAAESDHAGIDTAAKGQLVKQAKTTIASLERAEQQLATKEAAARTDLDYCIPQLADIKAKLQRLKEQSSDVDNTANPFREQIADLKKRRSKLAQEFKQQKELWQSKSQALKRAEFWVGGFRDVKLYIIEELMQELQLCSDAILAQLGLPDWSLQFDIEKETKTGSIQRGMNVFVQSPDNDKPVKWECWSGGEAQRLRIGAALGLSEVLLARAGIEPSIEVLDEPSTHLSPQGVLDLIDFLSSRARQLGRTIFLIDQTAIASGKFAGTLTVVRRRGQTRIVES